MNIVGHTGRHGRSCRKAESLPLHAVSDFSGLLGTILVKDLRQYLLQLFLRLNVVVIREVVWQNLIKEDAAQSCLAHFALGKNTDWGLQLNCALIVRHLCLINRAVGFDIVSLSLRLVVS